MALRILGFVALLAALAGVVSNYPFLLELLPLGAIGGAYWLFFHKPPVG